MVYLDMDDLLAGFSNGAYNWLTKYLGRPINKWPGRHRCGFHEDYGLSHREFFNILPKGFWENLEPLASGMAVYDYLRSAGASIYLLITVTYESPYCAHEKYLWVRKHMPDMINRIITTHVKHQLWTHREDLLIDDNEDNVNDWPGLAILWPTWANTSTKLCGPNSEPDPKIVIDVLKKMGYVA